MIIIRFLLIGFLSLITLNINAQWSDTIDCKFSSYELKSIYDTAKYCSDLFITRNGKQIYKEDCVDARIMSINAQDLEGNGNKYIFIETYSGGAHCCTYLLSAKLTEDKFIYTDSLWWGNSGYEIRDIDNDGKKEMLGYNDMFAYAFTNFAQSRFPIVIYRFKNGKFLLANSDFEDKVLENIKELKDELKDYTKSGYDCPRGENEDTFNTDAGAVKAILAPIVADYASIGKIDEGYEFVKKTYKCPDRDKFIKILKNDYKLK